MFHRFGQSKTREILKREKRDASATKKKIVGDKIVTTSNVHATLIA